MGNKVNNQAKSPSDVKPYLRKEDTFWLLCYCKKQWKQSLKVGDMIDVLHKRTKQYTSFKITQLNTTGDCTLHLEREYKQRENNICSIETESYKIPKWNGSTLMFPYGTKSVGKQEDIDTFHYNIAHNNDKIIKEICQSLKKNKIDINEVDPNYSTPLICALQHNHPHIAIMLLNEFETEININCQNNRFPHITPLGICCDKHYYNVIDKLFTFDGLLTNASGRTSVNGESKPLLAYCVQTNNMKMLKYLLENHRCMDWQINELDSNGHTAVFYACSNNQLEMLNALLSNEHCDPNRTASRASAPINAAVQSNHFKIINRLLEYHDHVQPIDFNHVGSFGVTCLIHFCSQGHTKYIKEVLRCGADVTILNSHKSPIYYAIKSRQTESEQKAIIELLLSHPNTTINIEDVVCAIEKRKNEIVKLLLDSRNVPLNLSYIETINGLGDLARSENMVNINRFSQLSKYTPLYAAVSATNPELVKMLIEYGADVEQGNGSETPIDKAAKLGESLSLYYLLMNGAFADVNTFFLSLRGGDVLCVKYLYEYRKDIIKDINMRGKRDNLTPLMVVVKRSSYQQRLSANLQQYQSCSSKCAITGYLRQIGGAIHMNIPNIVVFLINEYYFTDSLIGLLLRYGANARMTLPDGVTILNECIRNTIRDAAGPKEIIEHLLHKTSESKTDDPLAYVYHYDLHGKNALSYACAHGQFHVVEMLMAEYDALEYMWTRDRDGKLCYDIAYDKGNYGNAKYIMEHMYKHKKCDKTIKQDIKKTRAKIKEKEKYARTHKHRVKCFDGFGQVLMRNGSYKCVKDVCVGDEVATLIGHGYSTVKCIQISELNRSVQMVYIGDDCNLMGGVWITFEHPILWPVTNIMHLPLETLGAQDVKKYNLDWVLPKNINNVELRYQDKLYNFVLEENHTLNVNGFWCITLGHDFKGEGIEHELYGNSKAMDAFLKTSPTYPVCVFDC
eukprot:58744_1